MTSGLTKRYGDIAALTDVHLRVPSGSIYGFLGPNGAGKTTTIRCLMGFIRPTSGNARIFGRDCWADGVEARRDVGFLVTADALYPDMTGTAQLDYAARLSGRAPVVREEVREALELDRAALVRRLGTYSKGMRQKLALIAAMQHDPALLVLDEPTDGLDPLIQRNFEELLRRRRDSGRTIFMSSHDLAEVERTCEKVAVVRSGRVVDEQTIDGLRARHRRRATVVFADAVPEGFAALPQVVVVRTEGRMVEATLDADLDPVLRYLAGHAIADLTISPPSLEDIFMGYYGTGTAGATSGGVGR